MVKHQHERERLAYQEAKQQAAYAAKIKKYNEELAAYWQKVAHLRTLLRLSTDHDATIEEVERTHLSLHNRPLRPPIQPMPEPPPPTRVYK